MLQSRYSKLELEHEGHPSQAGLAVLKGHRVKLSPRQSIKEASELWDKRRTEGNLHRMMHLGMLRSADPAPFQLKGLVLKVGFKQDSEMYFSRP